MAAGRGCCEDSEPQGLAFPREPSAPAGWRGRHSPPREPRSRAGVWEGLAGPSLTGSSGSRLRVVLNGQRRCTAHAHPPAGAGACAGNRGMGAAGVCPGTGAIGNGGSWCAPENIGSWGLSNRSAPWNRGRGELEQLVCAGISCALGKRDN